MGRNSSTQPEPSLAVDVVGGGNKDGSSPNRRITDYLDLKFPVFNGVDDDVFCWEWRVELYFKLCETPEEEWVDIAAYHLEGKAFRWYRFYVGIQGKLTWQELVEGLKNRFEPTLYQYAFGHLGRLTQDGSLEDYLRQFERYGCRVTGKVPEHLWISVFISGLNPELRFELLKRKPQTISDTISLARMNDKIIQPIPEEQ